MHQIGYRIYHCSTTENQILKDLNAFAFDEEESSGYHGNIKFHRDIICKSEEEAKEIIDKLDKGWYDDHAVFYKQGRKKYWLVKYEFHC